jgi:hypothetical protein
VQMHWQKSVKNPMGRRKFPARSGTEVVGRHGDFLSSQMSLTVVEAISCLASDDSQSLLEKWKRPSMAGESCPSVVVLVAVGTRGSRIVAGNAYGHEEGSHF